MALRRLDLRGRATDRRTLRRELPAPVDEQHRSAGDVSDIVAQVRRDGDAALRRLTEAFDGAAVDDLRVPEAAAKAALARIPGDLRAALEVAHDRIRDYHAHEAVAAADELRSGGVTVRQLLRPVDRAGCYAPGGRARYPSTVLMTAVPARVAGVGQVALCVPPRPDGQIDDATLAAAALAGVDEVYRVGGAQAIAALAYGTETIEPVDVVVGPGNRYVAEAKRQVSGVVGVASAFAGPSEVVVVADADTPSDLCAVDLLVQAEHGPDGLAWLVTWSEEKAAAVDEAVERLTASSPRRAELEATLSAGGWCVVVDGPEQAAAVVNVVAPEHLELLVDDDVAERLLDGVSSAGAIFVGTSSPASMGDYLAGPNHVLPTNRSARFASSLRVEDFVRRLHAVTVSPRALEELGPYVVTLAEAEGLPAHAESVRLRWDR